jgi:hypothetical protein
MQRLAAGAAARLARGRLLRRSNPSMLDGVSCRRARGPGQEMRWLWLRREQTMENSI